MGLFTFRNLKSWSPTWHYLQSLSAFKHSSSNSENDELHHFHPCPLDSLSTEWLQTTFRRLCNSDLRFTSGRCIRWLPFAVFVLPLPCQSSIYLSAHRQVVCESRQAVFAERFVIIRRPSLGQRSRAPLPGWATPALPILPSLLPVCLNGASPVACRRQVRSWWMKIARKAKEAD